MNKQHIRHYRQDGGRNNGAPGFTGLLECGPYPLGARWDGRGTRFAVFAEHAENVELCLFDETGRKQIARLPLPCSLHGVWSGYLPDAGPGTQYGYRVYGPYEPKRGHRFNHNKLLLDPYARKTAGELRWHDSLFGYQVGSSRGDLSFDRRDSAPYMPKGVVVRNDFDWEDDCPPRVPWTETVIYEMHVRGFSKLRRDLPEPDRGSFAALANPEVIAYLKDLGVTAVELLPVHLFLRDRYLIEKQLTNYWGYNTLGFFAPEPAYLVENSINQMKWAIKELHRSGIEVILDVVYNHTCEGNELGPTLSWRGFGNASYYRLMPDDCRYHINDTGCGNTLNISHPRVIQMVMDSLRYWVETFHVDGFRFDLCASLGREEEGFDTGSGFFDALSQDPVLARVKLIAEPWDIGPGGHQVGNHPPVFAEWNDYFRDDLRGFWRCDHETRGALAARLQGSAEIFDHAGRRPWSSVNFVTAHDGFTLKDLVSYESKHNESNGEGNNDGSDNNLSSNWGEEGETADPEILALRNSARRNLLMTLACSHGVPMILAGDEFGQTQHGNNNSYCQDNEVSWLDWTLLEDQAGREMHEFVRRILSFRRSSELLQGHYFQHAHIEIVPGVPDVFWFDENGTELEGKRWRHPDCNHLGMQRCRQRSDGQVDFVVLIVNAEEQGYQYRLPVDQLQYSVWENTAPAEEKPDKVCAGSVHVHGRSSILLGTRIPIDKLRLLVGTDEQRQHTEPRLEAEDYTETKPQEDEEDRV